MSQKSYFVVSGTIFGLVAILHLLRSLYRWPAQVGSWAVPPAVSWVGLILAAALCIWAFRLARR